MRDNRDDKDNKNLTKNIKSLVVFFAICFFSIIVYLTYFNLYVGDKILDDPSNKRIRAEENEVLRGSILDSNGKVIAKSERQPDGNQKRIYEQGQLFSHVIGYNSYVYGKTGIESSFNDVLQGKATGHDVFGSIFRTLKESMKKEEKRGSDVVLTLDSNVQKAALKALGDEKGAIVAMDPKTGQVISMVSTPTFDPENIDKKFKDYNKDDENTPLINRATHGSYLPGSVFKIVTATAGYEGMSNIESFYDNCDGGLKIYNYTLKDYGGASHGNIEIGKAIEKSCNHYFGTLGMKLGYDKLLATAEKFMFNKEMPKDMGRYSIPMKTGKINVKNKKDKASLAQDSIGQNQVSSSPIQMAMVASAVANDGKLMTPYVVKEIKDRYGKTIDTPEPKVLSEVMDSSIANKLTKHMTNVVKSGTGKKASIKGITVAGKTGSAQQNDKNGKEMTHSWFIGFAPADNPKIAIAVIIENGGVGGVKAAQAAKEVLESYLK